ncbi:MAG: hypothetical protein WAP03_27540 [Methylorubrum rhodinum]|uniref:hypothetical protein n=1 Tax=Methylorubrum rhodinum TaxID=29428 RepID=UPI003BB01353
MRPRAGWSLALLLAWAASPPALAADPAADASIRQAFARCRAVEEEHARLACYDRLALQLAPPRFQGRLTLQTEPFEIGAPTLLRYESDGPIFVMYLKDAAGGIVQNLHIGGGGGASFLIERPGTYSLHINGSETWRIWLDPA